MVMKCVLAFLFLKFGPGESIGEVNDLELPGEYIEDGAQEDILQLQCRVLAPFQEYSLVLDVILTNNPTRTISIVLSFR